MGGPCYCEFINEGGALTEERAYPPGQPTPHMRTHPIDDEIALLCKMMMMTPLISSKKALRSSSFVFFRCLLFAESDLLILCFACASTKEPAPVIGSLGTLV